jgi:hypothetical protein
MMSLAQSNTLVNMKIQISRVSYLWTLATLSIIACIARVMLMPNYVEDYDGMYFVASLERYSVIALRPHFPGYPIFVWLGSFFNLFTRDATLALHLVSVLATTLTAIPIANLAKSWKEHTGNPDQARATGLLAALLWWLIPISWIDGLQIFADPLGSFLAILMLMLTWRSVYSSNNKTLILAALTAGIMLGVRSQYIAFLPALLLGYTWRSKNHPLESKYSFWVALIIPILIWFGWQLSIDGMGFFQAAQSTAVGHYTNWGVSAATDNQIWTRPVRILETIWVLGMGGGGIQDSLIRMTITFITVPIFLFGIWSIRHSSRIWQLSICFIVPHLIWWLTSLDPVTGRYALPIVAWICIITAVGISQLPRLQSRVLTLILFGLLGFISLPLAKEHQQSPPLELQMATYFQDRPNLEDVLLFQPGASLQLQQALPELRLEQLPLTSVGANRMDLTAFNRQVYGTSYRLESFQAALWWQPVKRLCRNRFLRIRSSDPLEVMVYRYAPMQKKQSRVELLCGQQQR